jgi:hypothetical protein
MPTIRVATDIVAPPPRCFDLARSVDAHVESATGTGERAIAGVMKGLLGLGDAQSVLGVAVPVRAVLAGEAKR